MEETVLEHVGALYEIANGVAKETKIKRILWGSLASYAIYKCAKNTKFHIESESIAETAKYILHMATGE